MYLIVSLVDGQFDLLIKENCCFVFQWKVVLEVQDDENLVDFFKVFYFSEFQFLCVDQVQVLDVSVKEVVVNLCKYQYIFMFEIYDIWFLQQINDWVMEIYNLSCKVYLLGQCFFNWMFCLLKGFIFFLKIELLVLLMLVEIIIVFSFKGGSVLDEGEGQKVKN